MTSDSLTEPILDKFELTSFYMFIYYFESCPGTGKLTLSDIGGAWLDQNIYVLFVYSVNSDESLDDEWFIHGTYHVS